MNIGESANSQIRARLHWNETGIQLVAGEQYLITASGEWVDFFIKHGPDGDPSPNAYMRSFESQRRMPNEFWFALIGGLDSNLETAFLIGSRCQYTAVKSGQLCCFANDVDWFYWNNWGSVSMTVTRSA